MKRSIILFVIAFLIVGVAVCIYLKIDSYELKKKGAYSFLMESDKDNVYQRLVFIERKIGKDSFNLLVTYLVGPENKDMLTQNAAIRHIRENKDVLFLSNLIELQESYEKVSPDSIWYTEGLDVTRLNRIKGSVLISDLNKTIQILEKKSSAIHDF